MARINWNEVKRMVDNADVEVHHEADELGALVQGIFLGTIMALTPSGKVYAPWSSVADSTRTKDAIWWSNNERAANARNLTLEISEGDGCDILVRRYIEPLVHDFTDQPTLHLITGKFEIQHVEMFATVFVDSVWRTRYKDMDLIAQYDTWPEAEAGHKVVTAAWDTLWAYADFQLLVTSVHPTYVAPDGV